MQRLHESVYYINLGDESIYYIKDTSLGWGRELSLHKSGDESIYYVNKQKITKSLSAFSVANVDYSLYNFVKEICL